MKPESIPQQRNNADYAWDAFDAVCYYQHNYSKIRADDAQILDAVRDFFVAVPPSTDAAQGLDVGSGANLYPALAMLPFVQGGLTLWEYSATNVDWLRHQVKCYSAAWDPFWQRLTTAPAYRDVADPRALLADRGNVYRGSIFDLPAANWDIGTMFFVAESMTSDFVEFVRATDCFLGALRPGAPFAAAFMENSTGYDVGNERFPAIAVTTDTIHERLSPVADRLTISHIGLGDDPVRAGYTGMILALGTIARATQRL